MKTFIVVTAMDLGRTFPGWRLNVGHIVHYSPTASGSVSEARTHIETSSGAFVVSETVEQIDALIAGDETAR